MGHQQRPTSMEARGFANEVVEQIVSRMSLSVEQQDIMKVHLQWLYASGQPSKETITQHTASLLRSFAAGTAPPSLPNLPAMNDETQRMDVQTRASSQEKMGQVQVQQQQKQQQDPVQVQAPHTSSLPPHFVFESQLVAGGFRTLDKVLDSESLVWRPAADKGAKHKLQASAPHEDHIATSGKQARARRAMYFQMLCAIGSQPLAPRLDAAIERMAAEDIQSSPDVHAALVACATTLHPQIGQTEELDLQPEALEGLNELWRGLAKSSIISCTYNHILGQFPSVNTFTPELLRVKPGSALAKQIESEGQEKPWLEGPQRRFQQPKGQISEAQADCLGSCASSLALELMTLIIGSAVKVPSPPGTLFDKSNSSFQTSTASTPPPDMQSSGTNALRSRLAKKAEQQQQARKAEQQQQAEAEWLQEVERIQGSQAVRWRDLVAVLFYLPEFMKPDADHPRTFWRVVVSAHLAACVCRLLGTVFAWAGNKEPLALKMLACPSAEELAGILTMQVSSLAMQWSMTSHPREALPSCWLMRLPKPLNQEALLLEQINSLHDMKMLTAAPDYTDDLLRVVGRCWDFALACWQEARKEKQQGSSPLKSSSNAKRKGGDVAGSSHMSAAMKVGSDGSNAPVVFWGRAVHACAWAAHVLLARSFSVSMVCPYGVPTMVARHCMDVSLLRVVVQTLQDLQLEGEQEQAGCARPSRARPSSSVAAASAGALLLESVAGRPWLWHDSGSDEKLVLHEQLLRRANTLAACMRLQLNSTVAKFSMKASKMGSKSKTEAAAEGCSAAAAEAQGAHASPQFSSSLAQAAFAKASASGSQAHGVPGAEGSSGGRDSSGGADDVRALGMNVASLFTAACRLVCALHPLFFKPEKKSSEASPSEGAELRGVLRLLLRQNARMLAEAICLQVPKLTTVVGLTGVAAAELLQQLLQMALYLKTPLGLVKANTPRVSPLKLDLLFDSLSTEEICRPVLVQGKPSPTIARFLLPRPTLASHLCQIMHFKACRDMWTAVDSVEKYNVVGSTHVFPKLKLLQQLLPSLTSKVSTNPFSNSPDPMDRPVPYAMSLEEEYLGWAGAAWLMGSFFMPLVRIACFIEAAPLTSLTSNIKNRSSEVRGTHAADTSATHAATTTSNTDAIKTSATSMPNTSATHAGDTSATHAACALTSGSTTTTEAGRGAANTVAGPDEISWRQQRQQLQQSQLRMTQMNEVVQQSLEKLRQHFCCQQELRALKLLRTLQVQADRQQEFDLEKHAGYLQQQLRYMEGVQDPLRTQHPAYKPSDKTFASADAVIQEFVLSCARYQRQWQEGIAVCQSDLLQKQRVIAQLQAFHSTRWKELVQLYQDRARTEQWHSHLPSQQQQQQQQQILQPPTQQQQQQQQQQQTKQQLSQPPSQQQQQQQQSDACPSTTAETTMQCSFFAPCPLTQGMRKQLTLLLQQPGASDALRVAASFCPREVAAVDSYFTHKGFGSLCGSLPEQQARRVRECAAELHEEMRELESAHKQQQQQPQQQQQHLQQQHQGEWVEKEQTPAEDSVRVGHEVNEHEHQGQQLPELANAAAAGSEEDASGTAAAAAAAAAAGCRGTAASALAAAGPEEGEGGGSCAGGQQQLPKEQEQPESSQRRAQKELLVNMIRLIDEELDFLEGDREKDSQQRDRLHWNLKLAKQRVSERQQRRAELDGLSYKQMDPLELQLQEVLRKLQEQVEERQCIEHRILMQIQEKEEMRKSLCAQLHAIESVVSLGTEDSTATLSTSPTNSAADGCMQDKGQAAADSQPAQQVHNQRCKSTTSAADSCVQGQDRAAAGSAPAPLSSSTADGGVNDEGSAAAGSAPAPLSSTASSTANGGVNDEGSAAAGSAAAGAVSGPRAAAAHSDPSHGAAAAHSDSSRGGAAAHTDSSRGAAAAAGGGGGSVEDDLQPLNSADAAQLARQQQSWKLMQLGLKIGTAPIDAPLSEPRKMASTTTSTRNSGSTAKGHQPPPWQPLCLIDQFLDPDAQRSRMHAQLCYGTSMCNGFVESHKVALADAGIPAPSLLPLPPLPPGTSPQAPPWTQLPPPSLHEHLVTASLGLQKYAEANSDALVRSFAQEVGKERLHALVSSPFSLRLARWHDSLTKLHYAANSLAVDAAEELQRRAASANEDKETRENLHEWKQECKNESLWRSQLVACSNISCGNLTRQRSSRSESTEGVVCPACLTAVFCSHTCLLVAMTGPQAHCWLSCEGGRNVL